RCCPIQHEDDTRMQLNGGGRCESAQRSFDGFGDDLGLMCSKGQKQESSRLTNSTETHGYSPFRDRLAIKDPTKILFGRRAQENAPRSGIEAGTWFIESKVAVPSDPQDLQIDTALVLDEPLIGNTGGGDALLGRPAQQMEMSRLDIEVVDQMLMIEHTIVIRAVAPQPDELVEAKKPDARKIEMRSAV